MTDNDYFSSVGTKSFGRAREHFTTEGTLPDLLPDNYKLYRKASLTREKINQIQSDFAKWCELLFCGFNIAVLGPQSKFNLLETFKAKYLDSEQLPDYTEEALNGRTKKQKLSITTVRLHGLDPISMETFVNSVFGVTDRRHAKQTDLKKFLDKSEADNEHYVFMIHSFDKFLKHCEDVWELIMSLLASNKSTRMHLILSADSINAGKKLSTLKFKLKLIFFASPFGESFLSEKIQIANEIGDVNGLHRLFDDFIGLQTLKDVFSAIGTAPRKVLLLILTEFIQKSEMKQNDDEENKGVINRRTTRAADPSEKQRKATKQNDALIYFSELLSNCTKKFIVQQSFKLRSYLDELADHKVVLFNETTIECLVSVPCSKKFLEYVAAENLDGLD